MARDYKHRADLPQDAHKRAQPRQSAPQTKNRRVQPTQDNAETGLSLQTIGSFALIVGFIGLLYSLSDSEDEAPKVVTTVTSNSVQSENLAKPLAVPNKIQQRLALPSTQIAIVKDIPQPPPKTIIQEKIPVPVKVIVKKEPVVKAPEATFEFYTSLPKAQFIIPDHKIKIYKRAERIGKTKKNARYTIQVASYRSQEEANKLKVRLLLMGLTPIIEKAKVSNSVWFRVKMGPYNTIKTADNIITQLHKHKLDAVMYGN